MCVYVCVVFVCVPILYALYVFQRVCVCVCKFTYAFAMLTKNVNCAGLRIWTLIGFVPTLRLQFWRVQEENLESSGAHSRKRARQKAVLIQASKQAIDVVEE
jgi:hypothetical protein